MGELLRVECLIQRLALHDINGPYEISISACANWLAACSTMNYACIEMVRKRTGQIVSNKR